MSKPEFPAARAWRDAWLARGTKTISYEERCELLNAVVSSMSNDPANRDRIFEAAVLPTTLSFAGPYGIDVGVRLFDEAPSSDLSRFIRDHDPTALIARYQVIEALVAVQAIVLLPVEELLDPIADRYRRDALFRRIWATGGSAASNSGAGLLEMVFGACTDERLVDIVLSGLTVDPMSSVAIIGALPSARAEQIFDDLLHVSAANCLEDPHAAAISHAAGRSIAHHGPLAKKRRLLRLIAEAPPHCLGWVQRLVHQCDDVDVQTAFVSQKGTVIEPSSKQQHIPFVLDE